jgi:uncharacterized protein involved in copper resistance
MQRLRALILWMLVLSLPIEGMASVSMAHCKDQPIAALSTTPIAHDHAAMMAMAGMGDDEAMAHMHHAMPSSNADEAKDSSASKSDCQCGCNCSDDCAVACAGVMLSMPQAGFTLLVLDAFAPVVMPHGQAHAAYRYDPLRPPSAVAL